MLPLYLYEHSILTISVDGWRYPYNDPWDAGLVGWIFVTKARLREEYRVKRITKKILQKAEKVLQAEVEDYDQYLRGEVYGFTVWEINEGEITELDSCGGFIGDDPTKNGMLEHVPEEFREFLRSAGYLDDNFVVSDQGKTFWSSRELRDFLVENSFLPECFLKKCSLLQRLRVA